MAPISIDQAALTGESLPVSKKVGDEGYSGSIAKKGEMSAVVLCVILVGFELYQDIVVKHPWAWSELGDIARMVLALLSATIPVAKPTVITITNSLGAQALARKKAIVSRLEAIEELARVDILCSDNTGTLTKNILTLGDPILFDAKTADELILAGALASEKGSEDAIDKAVSGGVKDSKARRYTKGAPEVIIELSTLDADGKAKAAQTVADLAAKGMRALGIAESTDEGKSWSFLGILSMLDPPRDDSKQTIEQAKAHGLWWISCETSGVHSLYADSNYLLTIYPKDHP